MTDVNYYKEGLIRTSKGKEIYRRIVPPDWREPESDEIFYTKPRAVLTVNGKEIDILPEKLREKIIVDARNHEIKRQLPTNKQADSLINLISKQVEHTLDIPNDIEVEEFAKFIENVDKDVYASAEFQDDDYTFTIDLQSNMIEDDFTTWDLDRTSLKEAKREVESFVKWHKIAVQKEESEPEFKDSLYGALYELEYEQVLINGELKYGGEWLQEIGNSKDGDEIFGKSVEVYRRSDDGIRVFEIEPKEVLQQSISDRTHQTTSRTSKHQAIERDTEER